MATEGATPVSWWTIAASSSFWRVVVAAPGQEKALKRVPLLA
jgi:hypothetical protein